MARTGKEIEFEFREGEGEVGNFVPAGRIREVVMRHLQIGEVDRAVSVFAAASAEVADALLEQDTVDASVALKTAMAEMFIRARDFERAGKAALLLGDPGRAAPFFERSYQFTRAAELYEKAGKDEQAAELYVRDLKYDVAARLYQKAGAVERAAEVFEKGSRHFDAGVLWAKVRRFDKAVEALQRVEPDSSERLPALVLLGRVLEHAGHVEAAMQRYYEVVKIAPPTPATAHAFERLARHLMTKGQEGQAQRLLALLRDVDRSAKAPPSKARSVHPPSRQAPGAPTVPKPADSSSALSGSRPSFRPPAPSIGAWSPDKVAPLDLPAPPRGVGGAEITAIHPDINVLRELPLFGELSLDELRGIHGIAERRAFAPGERMIAQDREADALFVVVQGKVAVFRVDGGHRTPLAELGFGAALGEMALVDEGPASAEVTAKTDVQAFAWPLAALRRHLLMNERTALKLLRVMSRTLSVRLRETNRRVSG
jgi:tetratricopeptide (TPR) repeat protein